MPFGFSPTASIVISTLIGASSGRMLAQTLPVSDQTPVALGLLTVAVAFAFAVGVQLTGLKRDIKELRGDLAHLPCQKNGGKCLSNQSDV